MASSLTQISCLSYFMATTDTQISCLSYFMATTDSILMVELFYRRDWLTMILYSLFTDFMLINHAN